MIFDDRFGTDTQVFLGPGLLLPSLTFIPNAFMRLEIFPSVTCGRCACCMNIIETTGGCTRCIQRTFDENLKLLFCSCGYQAR